MSDTHKMLSARRCQYENPSLPKYIVPYEDAAQVEHELNQCLRELAAAKAEAEKWEKLHDQDTEHLASLQKRDNYGPTETLNETAMRLSRELAEARKMIGDMEGGVRETGFELYEARKQRDTLAEALDLSLSILIALMDENESAYDLVVTTTNKSTGEENKMSIRNALEKSIAALAAVKGGEA